MDISRRDAAAPERMQIRHVARKVIIKACRASRGAHSPQVATLTDVALHRNEKIGFNCPDLTSSTSRLAIKSPRVYLVAKSQRRHVNSSRFREYKKNNIILFNI